MRRGDTIRNLQAGEPVPTKPPRRYPNGAGYIRLRWKIGVAEYVEVYEHRVVDGFVTNAEHVHHDNRVRDDNDSENLVPLTADEHNALHADARRGQWTYAPYRSKHAKEKAERAKARRRERLDRALLMRAMYVDEQLGLIEIGERVGLHSSNVMHHLRAVGVQMRPAGRGRARPKRATGEDDARDVVSGRSNGACEGCDAARATDWSHRIGAGVGGEWRGANGLHLCRGCHTWLHLNPEESRLDVGWRLESTDDPLLVPVWLPLRGWVFLTDDGGFVPSDLTARQVLQTDP